MRDHSTILHRLQLWAKDQPGQAAFHYKVSEEGGWSAIPVSLAWSQVARFALALRDFGVKRGDRVGLFASNSPEWVQWEFAIWLSGGISAGIHPQTRPEDLNRILSHLAPSLVLSDSGVYREQIDSALAGAAPVLSFSEAVDKMLTLGSYSPEEIEARGLTLLQALKPDEPCMIIHTSGSTGIPKGVVLGLRQLTFTAESLAREWRLPYMDGDLFSFLPLSHIAEKIQTMAVAAIQRYPVWFNSGSDRFLPELLEVRPTMLLAVPRVWERFKEQAEDRKPMLLQRVMEVERIGRFAEKMYLGRVREQLGLDRLKLAVSGAAKLPPAIAEWYRSIGIEIQEIYGMSESCGLISLTKPPRKDFSSLGEPPAGVEVRIAMDGEIQVRGPNVFSGYWGDPEATREVLLPEGWLKTGDLGEQRGGLHIIGRNRDIIKLSNGRMVAPLPMENALKEISEVSNVCVVGEGKPSPLALITLKEEALLELRFKPGAIEGLVVEEEGFKKRMGEKIRELIRSRAIAEPNLKFVILARDFSMDQQELTQTQKLNRNQIQRSYRHFIDLQFEG